MTKQHLGTMHTILACPLPEDCFPSSGWHNVSATLLGLSEALDFDAEDRDNSYHTVKQKEELKEIQKKEGKRRMLLTHSLLITLQEGFLILLLSRCVNNSSQHLHA